jgi:hypothetical protein
LCSITVGWSREKRGGWGGYSKNSKKGKKRKGEKRGGCRILSRKKGDYTTVEGGVKRQAREKKREYLSTRSFDPLIFHASRLPINATSSPPQPATAIPPHVFYFTLVLSYKRFYLPIY